MTAAGPSAADIRREGDELAAHVKTAKEVELKAELKMWWDQEQFIGRVLEPLLKTMAPHAALHPAGGVGDLVLMFDETNVEKVRRRHESTGSARLGTRSLTKPPTHLKLCRMLGGHLMWTTAVPRRQTSTSQSPRVCRLSRTCWHTYAISRQC